MLFLHGTTASAARSIVETGFQAVDTVWTCSDPRNTYIVEVGTKYDEREAVCFACDNARIAAAKLGVQDTDIVIFGFDFPSDIADENLLPDISCANMDDCWSIDNDTLNSLIQSGKVSCTAKVIKNAYIPYLRPFYLTQDTRSLMTLDKELEYVCGCLENKGAIDMFYDMMFFIDFEDFNTLCDFV